MKSAMARFAAANKTYQYCSVCGHWPEKETPNHGPLRFWDCDDGWKIGNLCAGCADETLSAVPHKDDYAFKTTNGVCDGDPMAETDDDEGMLDALLG